MKKSFKKYEKAGLPGGPNELKRFTNGFIVSERGQWDYPGQPTAVPTPTGKITTQGVEDDLVGIDNLGNMQYMTPNNEYQFEGDMVYEIPQAKRGGSKKPSKKYSRSLMAKNRLFAKNPLFKKPKSVKNKIFDPYSPYFQPGGETYNQLPSRYKDALKNFVYPEVVDSSEETGYDAALGVIKQNPNDPIANVNNPWWYEHELMHHLQNQAGGMSTYGSVGLRPNPYVASDEAIGSYYDRRGSEFETELNRILEENPDISEEEAYIRAEEDLYNNPTTTEGEARNYEGYIEAGNPSIFPKKPTANEVEVELTEDEIEEYRKGGYIVEDISVPSLTKASYGYSVGNLIRKQDGGSVSGTQGLTADFSQRLTKFILDARSQGVDLGVGSGYRSYEKQKRLWEQALKKYGSPEKARKWVAPPGGSFHNKGLAVDLNANGQFLGKDANSKATEWAHANAKKYGLHFRMGHEPWHIEPIEKTKSNSEKENEHDHDHGDEVIVDTYGAQPDVTTKEELELIQKNKDLEFKQKQAELAEQERQLHDDDYSNWEPSKDEFIDPSKKMLEEYSKIINPSSQNMYALYNANLQGKMKNGGIIVEVDDDEIEELKRGGYVVEELSYAQNGLEQKTVTPDWQSSPTTSPGVFAPPTATTATEEEIVEEPIVKKEEPIIKSPAPVNKGKVVPPAKDNSVKALQLKLKNAGYDLGKSGPSGDGVDGVMGNKTKVALEAFNAGIPANKIKVADPKKPIKGQTKNYTVNTNLKDGYLPYLDKGEETCVKGKGCSANVSIKMGSLLGNITDKSLWANDAWFNKSEVLNKGGDLIYENKERDYTKMQKVPKDVWNKLQVGDYVQLNRKDTASSAKFAAQTKPGLKNEGIEHLGFVVGKDKDGTPLIWHGSETGKAYVQRIDEPLALHDENIITGTNNFTYQVASIVRSPHLKDKDLSGLQETAYYSPLDTKKKLVPKKGATPLQSEAVNIINKSVGQFKNIGYKQDDVNYVSQILIGGIMSNETKGGESNKRIPKEIAATIWKNYLGQGNFEGDEASIGYYQLKPNLNFKNKDGSLNTLGKKLEKLGMSVDDIGSFDIKSQTKAGTLLLLDAYSQLKKDKNFNPKTGLYKNKIPASYILAKSWQAGAGWYKKDKYKKYLNNFDVDYSNNALKNLKTIDVVGQDKSARSEYLKYVLPKVTKVQPKVYTFPEKKGVKYKKDNFGNWYINEGSKTQNKFVKINDPEGLRRKTLNAWDKKYYPTQPSKSYKTGGFVMELTDDEIQKYIDGGYVIEDID